MTTTTSHDDDLLRLPPAAPVPRYQHQALLNSVSQPPLHVDRRTTYDARKVVKWIKMAQQPREGGLAESTTTSATKKAFDERLYSTGLLEFPVQQAPSSAVEPHFDDSTRVERTTAQLPTTTLTSLEDYADQ